MGVERHGRDIHETDDRKIDLRIHIEPSGEQHIIGVVPRDCVINISAPVRSGVSAEELAKEFLPRLAALEGLAKEPTQK